MERSGPPLALLLRSHRASARLSQRALAARSGVALETISALERGLHTFPHAATVTLLAEALGLDPGERDVLLAAVRRRDPGPSPPRRRPARSSTPRELPWPAQDFTGRSEELARLHQLLDPAAGPHGLVAISAVDGMGGVGKSAFALHGAHQLAGAFPDGQLYVNLQGATPGLPPLAPLDALGHLLRSLGLEPGAVPTELDEAAARFRSLVAGRRLLVLLDNARDAEQVRPLVPGSPSCRVLVTSRQMMGTLEGTRTIHLDVLPGAEAVELLGRIVGPDRVAAEPEAALEVVRRCGGLPLAIRIAGSRLFARPTRRIQDMAARLADATGRLGELQAGELAVRASFDVSLRSLEQSADPVDRAAAEGFALLSLPDGPDLGPAAAARLLDRSEAETIALLERLVDAQLVENPRPGRYQLHDLVRLYAREDAARRHPAVERAAALTRLTGFYSATAWGTLALVRPSDVFLATADERWTGGGLTFAGPGAALDWLSGERPNLLAAIAQAARVEPGADAPPAELAVQLTRALRGFFMTTNVWWRDSIRANRAALDVGRRLRDRAAQAIALNDLGLARFHLGAVAEAVAHLEESVAVFRELGDRRGEAGSATNLGYFLRIQGRAEEATRWHEESLRIFDEIGDRRGSASTLLNLGVDYLQAGRLAEAAGRLEESIGMFRQLGDRNYQGVALAELGGVWGRLGHPDAARAALAECLTICDELRPHGQDLRFSALRRLAVVHGVEGRHEEAIACLEECRAIAQTIDNPRFQVIATRELGDALSACGRSDDARRAWEEGLAIGAELRSPEADLIRARLADPAE